MSIVIVHLSDLHFDTSFLVHGSVTSPVAAAAGAPLVNPVPPPVVRGLARHDVPACLDLVTRLRLLNRKWTKSRLPPLKLLAVTGDLTVCGHDGEFSQALTFLNGRVAINRLDETGLEPIGFRHLLAVPGNHDHWDGSQITATVLRGTQRRIHGTYFPRRPGSACWFREFFDPAGNFLLQIMGLDTNAGPGPTLPGTQVGIGIQPLAMGSIAQSDIDLLRDEVVASNQAHARLMSRGRIVRVLMVHHGLVPSPKWWQKGTHVLTSASQILLEDFVSRLHIHRLLAGHIHSPAVDAPVANLPQMLELRSGTTLQTSANAGQSFLVHELSDGVGSLQFATTLYQRSAGGSFGATKSRTDPL